MKLTEKQIRQIIREEVISEGFFDKLLKGLSNIIDPGSIDDNISLREAQKSLATSAIQYALVASKEEGSNDINQGLIAALEYIQTDVLNQVTKVD